MPFRVQISALVLISMVWCSGGYGFTQQRPPLVDGITFAGARTILFVPARDVGRMLGFSLLWNKSSRKLSINNRLVASRNLRRAPDGTIFIPVAALAAVGAAISWDGKRKIAAVDSGAHRILIRKGMKRVLVDRSKQQLVSRQGARIILKAPISTGVEGHNTPLGTFGAGPTKRILTDPGFIITYPCPGRSRWKATYSYTVSAKSQTDRRPMVAYASRLPTGTRLNGSTTGLRSVHRLQSSVTGRYVSLRVLDFTAGRSPSAPDTRYFGTAPGCRDLGGIVGRGEGGVCRRVAVYEESRPAARRDCGRRRHCA